MTGEGINSISILLYNGDKITDKDKYAISKNSLNHIEGGKKNLTSLSIKRKK